MTPALRDIRDVRDWTRIWKDKPGLWWCCCNGCTNGTVLDLYPCASGIGTWRYNLSGDSWTSKTSPIATHNPTGGWQSCSVSAAFYYGYKNGDVNSFVDEYVDDTWTTKTDPPSVETGGLWCGDRGGLNFWAAQPATIAEKNHQYSVAGDSWATKNAPTSDQASSTIGNIADTLFIVGGTNSVGTPQTLNSAYVTSTDFWTTGTPAPSAVVAQKGFTFYGPGYLHIVSGVVGGVVVTTNVRYQSSAWTTKTASTHGHSQGTSYQSDGEGVAMSGFPTGSGNLTTQTDAYDPSGDSWTAKTATPRTMEEFACGGI